VSLCQLRFTTETQKTEDAPKECFAWLLTIELHKLARV
jgi:hypothetical protein